MNITKKISFFFLIAMNLAYADIDDYPYPGKVQVEQAFVKLKTTFFQVFFQPGNGNIILEPELQTNLDILNQQIKRYGKFYKEGNISYLLDRIFDFKTNFQSDLKLIKETWHEEYTGEFKDLSDEAHSDLKDALANITRLQEIINQNTQEIMSKNINLYFEIKSCLEKMIQFLEKIELPEQVSRKNVTKVMAQWNEANAFWNQVFSLGENEDEEENRSHLFGNHILMLDAAPERGLFISEEVERIVLVLKNEQEFTHRTEIVTTYSRIMHDIAKKTFAMVCDVLRDCPLIPQQRIIFFNLMEQYLFGLGEDSPKRFTWSSKKKEDDETYNPLGMNFALNFNTDNFNHNFNKLLIAFLNHFFINGTKFNNNEYPRTWEEFKRFATEQFIFSYTEDPNSLRLPDNWDDENHFLACLQKIL